MLTILPEPGSLTASLLAVLTLAHASVSIFIKERATLFSPAFHPRIAAGADGDRLLLTE